MVRGLAVVGGEVYGGDVRNLAEGRAMNAGSESLAPARGVTRERRNRASNFSALGPEKGSAGDQASGVPKKVRW